MQKPKFDKYITEEEKQRFTDDFTDVALLISDISTQIVACRDPKDDKFLTLAVAANAEFIVTGDEDLLVLHPFRGIQIIKPAEFLNLDF